MREAGGVGLLPALWRRRTACRRNVLRSRRNVTASSLPGAAVVARNRAVVLELSTSGTVTSLWLLL